ncbi:hypothetical protein PSECIP111951_04106 [Pseudoalteromonas holothuriae]|uniref:Uncharacterized protein n=1 Tax=Pseudoalteromonas holothuriae TaxID=2963714 RepID=A0A9W4W4I1_9GAMM|nr:MULTISPECIES: hypothetical protein [unclassified Pseudoalteromonas]CAH9059052.1 hypothetical protein PSECIP111854_02326 [Pseudoalteromonas sp. CIP111854]CAH9068314.1 hypothetical protein PSECIP111951_04106 [Pseudoalteromonas sp. CIP111951]
MSKVLIALVIGGFVGIIIGTWLGFSLNIGRDRRCEFNEAIEPIRTALMKGEDISEQDISIVIAKLGKDGKAILNTYRKVYQPKMHMADVLLRKDIYGKAKCTREEYEQSKKLKKDAMASLLTKCKHR